MAFQGASVRGEPLRGKVAYLTGASAGIGAALAWELAGAGVRLVLGARRSERLEALADEIRGRWAEADVTCLPLDVASDASMDDFVRAARERAGVPDILVNNAGLALGADAVEHASWHDWERMLDTNVRAVFRLTRLLLPDMLSSGGGDIVMVGSVAGVDPYAGGSVYCASKAAVQAFASALRQETLGQGVRVLTVDPGLVETEFSQVRFGGDAARARVPYQGLTPLSAQDVAECISFALSRPRHVSLDRMLVLATDQAGTRKFHRAPDPAP